MVLYTEAKIRLSFFFFFSKKKSFFTIKKGAGVCLALTPRIGKIS